MPLLARRASMTALTSAEPLLEDLPFAADALANLARLAEVPESTFGDDLEWRAAVDIDGTTVLASARGDNWTIFAPDDVDPSDGMLAARRLHGMLGEKAADWDSDR
jgi:hypothetical protein